MNKYTPDYVSSPGETLQELLDKYEISEFALAKRTVTNIKYVHDLLQGKIGLTGHMAFGLERIFNVPASFWIERDGAYQKYLRFK